MVMCVHGVGINDANYVVNTYSDSGKQRLCPYYSVWKDMLRRCYSKEYQIKQPTYVDCVVTESWKIFSIFKKWMETQDWLGKALDKDLLNLGNKEYAPDKCIFVEQALNNLLTLRKNNRGLLPLGVCLGYRKYKSVYIARCSFDGKLKHLGVFDSSNEASMCYQNAKIAYIQKLALNEKNPIVRQALLNLY